MCLVLIAYKQHPVYDLVLLANRDEFYDRPTSPAEFWEDQPNVLAGRDLRAGGTWMGVTRQGRYAAVTNYREAGAKGSGAPSRGALVAGYLVADERPEAFMARLQQQGSWYNGFNLLAGDPEGLYYYSNRDGAVRSLAPGLYGLSNHLLDTPWFKVEQGKAELAAALMDDGPLSPDDLFPILANEAPAPDESLPDTGVGPDWERVLSSRFITSPSYGTRSSTVLLIDRTGQVQFVEQTKLPGASTSEVRSFSFEIES